ncbi:hypothetical protein D9757_001928 [Collybiopsis confluens]|uniref:OTU domain-containing protein n=1 Tax=Collybiopsis confluens TaxID=2823264 RepID=A0A8H5HXQ6_9AGAR|nr:hypothetical protein D9757_001928 [Collybiopsis confluens]
MRKRFSMGSKRNKLKKAFSTPFSQSPPPPAPDTNDDAELLDDLMAQLDSPDPTVQNESAQVIRDLQRSQGAENGQKKDSKNRFQARQVKKAAALAESYSPNDPEAEARLAKEARDEEADIMRVCDELNVQINPDGHCLYSAIADQLASLSIVSPTQANYATTRLAACNYIYTHPDDFIPFLPSTSGEDGPGALNAGIISPKEFEYYCQAIRDTAEWGGEPEILALSRAYSVPIHVIQSGKPPIVIHNPTGTPNDGDIRDKRVVRISYHRRMYGLGEHYNSLRPKSKMSNISHSIQNILA